MGKCKTHDEYVAELAIKNPDIKAIAQYAGANVPIEHYCIKHDVYWKISPHNVLSGHGCNECRIEKQRKSRGKTHAEYVKELSCKNPNIEVLEQYINNNTPILHHCKLDDYKWKATPGHILHGTGCPMCTNNAKKTTIMYEEELYYVNLNLEVLEPYINAVTPILHRCKIDGYEWKAIPNNVLRGAGCPRCANVLRKATDEYKKELEIINPDIVVIGEYINAKTPIEHYCKAHNEFWITPPESVLHGHGCPIRCIERIRNKLQKPHDQYIKDVENINKNIIVIGEYINSNTPIKHFCKICGCEWNARPCNILSGCGCPQCQESKGERQVRQWLEKYNITYIYQKSFMNCKDKNPLPFDFYIDKYNLCIEFDGIQHFEPIDFAGKGNEWAQKQFQTTQKHDALKTQYCKDNNMHLLRIPYFKNVEEELENFLFI